jgi:hypothetical protein
MSESTVRLRVQVVDTDPQILDLQVPTYLLARDLTQRIARDAGLTPYWPDRTRREYRLRARGRMVEGAEKLDALGVVDGELVYLLPEPPDDRVVERPLELPERRGTRPSSWPRVVASAAGDIAWTGGWAVALAASPTPWVAAMPGLALGMLCVSTARRVWGPPGAALRVGATGLALTLVLTLVAAVSPLLGGHTPADTALVALGALVASASGALVGWLAWWGQVEPLPPEALVVAPEPTAAATPACAICGIAVSADVRQDCGFACGKVMHVGCYKARVSMHRGDKGSCAVCGDRAAGQAAPLR